MREPADPDCSAPPSVGRRLAHAAADLAWLTPSAASLAALARGPSLNAWSSVRRDPAAVLLLLRHADPARPFAATAVHPDPALFDDALRLLDAPDGAWVDWSRGPARLIYTIALRSAQLAEFLARKGNVCDPDEAWVSGLLAPLGWLSACAVDVAAVGRCFADPTFAQDPLAAQRRCWGLDHSALARRLAHAWRLPAWAAALIGRLDLPTDVAVSLGADPNLFDVTRQAAAAAQQETMNVGLLAGRVEIGRTLDAPVLDESAHAAVWEAPHGQPLLRDLLTVAAENRRLRAAPRDERLQVESDVLHRALSRQALEEAARLRDGKLEALAEFAAGAGHEINNPLAVILGQAQYLLSHEADWFTAEHSPRVHKSLEAVIAQTRRVHALLRDLMQFARPAAPTPEWFDLPALLGEVAAAADEMAVARRVSLAVVTRPDRLAVYADPAQVRIALTCLLRNALEAAPASGFARLVLPAGEHAAPVEIIVEDSGPGPEESARPSLFDPFYSGRAAGRGRGLGLPIAWRMARLQGGDVRLEAAAADQPTRFVLSLPRSAQPPTTKHLEHEHPESTHQELAEESVNGCHA